MKNVSGNIRKIKKKKYEHFHASPRLIYYGIKTALVRENRPPLKKSLIPVQRVGEKGQSKFFFGVKGFDMRKQKQKQKKLP